jgi:hypothetical protein
MKIKYEINETKYFTEIFARAILNQTNAALYSTTHRVILRSVFFLRYCFILWEFLPSQQFFSIPLYFGFILCNLQFTATLNLSWHHIPIYFLVCLQFVFLMIYMYRFLLLALAIHSTYTSKSSLALGFDDINNISINNNVIESVTF